MIDKLMPQRYKTKIEHWIHYSGSRVSVKGFINYSIIISLLLGIITASFAFDMFLFVFIGVFLFVYGLFHGFLALAVEKRTTSVEKILPDALELMAANSRAGYIPSRALLLSARPEFGPLSDAIKRVGKEIITGDSLEDSLRKISKTIKSELLDRSMNLIIEGTKSGGQFATLLEENAEDIRRNQVIKKEVKANITIYIIFIGFAGVIAAPVLYALSGFLIANISGLTSSVTLPQTASSALSFIKLGGLELSQDFLYIFSLIAIFLTTSFGALIIGLIGTGKEKGGIKYVPIFVIIAMIIFFVSKIMISSIFSTFVNF